MSDDVATPGDETAAREAYTFRANPAAEALFARRSGAIEAAFFLPYLRPGMRLLDCGCGPGSVTIDLAAVVAPGAAVGIDLKPEQVARARTLASERGCSNVRFEVGSIYALPFADATFDAVFANMVLVHLGDPGAALREMRRVLKPGGVAGIHDTSFGLWQFSPSSPVLEAMRALRLRVQQHNGGSPFYAVHQRQLLLEAGFARSEASASFVSGGAGTLEKTRQGAEHLIAFLRGTAFTQTAIGQGWVDHAGLEAMCAAVQVWGERPDAFYLLARCAAVGWTAD